MAMSAPHEDADGPAPGTDAGRTDGTAARLFAEWIAACEAGEEGDVDGFCRRAGDAAPELRRRIRAFAVLRDLGATLEPTAARERELPRVHDALGRYRDLRLVGSGGLSQVFLAWDPDLEREVALKVLAPEHVRIDSARDWLLLEGRTLARLEAPGIVKVFEVGEAEGRAYVAMEFVAGPSLSDVIAELRARRGGAAERTTDARVARAADALAGIDARARLARSIALALAACHAGGVLHRDVKPGNVLLPAPLDPRVIDFGLAHLEDAENSLTGVTQRLVGTPAYIAPEQVERGTTGASALSDQFSFGVLLYELLTLEQPFARSTRTQTLSAIARALPDRLRGHDERIPADLEQICLHALERDPAARYASMSDLAADLDAFLDHRAISVVPAGPARRLWLWARRNRRDVSMAVIPAVLLVAGLTALRVKAFLGEHERWMGEWRSELEQVPAIAAADTMESAYGRAARLAARSTELDASPFSGVFAEATAARRDQLVRGLSRRLHNILEDGWSACALSLNEDREASEQALLRTWQSALVLDAALCPECEDNAFDRARGRLELPAAPAGTRLQAWRRIPEQGPESRLQPVDVLRVLTTGTYRVAWTDARGAPLMEIETWVEPASPRRQLELRPMPPGLRALMVHVPANRIEFPRARSVEHDAFWVMRRWVTRRDLEEGFGDGPLLAKFEWLRSAAQDEPTACISFAQAAAAARAASARMPDRNEAIALHRLAADPGSGIAPLPPGIHGEYLSGPRIDLDHTHLLFRPGAPAPAYPSFRGSGGYQDHVFAFRLVFSGPVFSGPAFSGPAEPATPR